MARSRTRSPTAFFETDAQARRRHRVSADRPDYGRGPRTVEYLWRGVVHVKHEAERTRGRRQPVHAGLAGTAGRHDGQWKVVQSYPSMRAPNAGIFG
jgi:hypothetical protein